MKKQSQEDGDLLLPYLGDLMKASSNYDGEQELFLTELDVKNFSRHQPTRIKQIVAKIQKMKNRRR